MPGAIVVRYSCGYGPAATDVPEPIRTAIKIVTAGMYDNRDPSMPIYSTYKENPMFQMLLSCQEWGEYR